MYCLYPVSKGYCPTVILLPQNFIWISFSRCCCRWSYSCRNCRVVVAGVTKGGIEQIGFDSKQGVVITLKSQNSFTAQLKITLKSRTPFASHFTYWVVIRKSFYFISALILNESFWILMKTEALWKLALDKQIL